MKKDIESTELKLAGLLKAGVLTSAAVIAFGLALYLITGQSGYPEGAFPADPAAILAGLVSLKPYAVMLTGLFILILTPILRVGTSIIVFLHEKDYLYVAITGFVFVILLVSLFLGNVE
jgi:uncharacterized membrane protein